MRTTLATLAAAAVLAGCASNAGTGPAPSAQTTHTVLIDTNGLPESVSSSIPVASRTTTLMKPAEALAAVQAAYAVVGIPVTLRDSAAMQVGNPRFSVRGHLNGKQMSTYLNCGRTMTANHADEDQILMSVVTTVRGAGGGSVVETLVTANAVDRSSGNASSMQTCDTTGALETALHRAAFGQQ